MVKKYACSQMVTEAIKINPCWSLTSAGCAAQSGLKAQGTSSKHDFLLIKNIQEISVFAARMRLDGLFSVCGCLFYSNLQVDFWPTFSDDTAVIDSYRFAYYSVYWIIGRQFTFFWTSKVIINY